MANEPALTEIQRAQVNRTAQRLFAHLSGDAFGDDATEIPVEVLAWTAASDAAGSLAALRQCLGEDRIAKRGHHELPDIAKHLVGLADIDPSFVEDFVAAVARAEADDGQVTRGGRILALTFRKRDLLSLADHEIERQYSTLLRRHPRLGASVLIKVLDGYVRRKESHFTETNVRYTFMFEDAGVSFIPDGSYIWDSGSAYHDHELWSKLAKEFRLWMSSEDTTAAEVALAMEAFRQSAQYAICWKQLLLSAHNSPEKHLRWAKQLLVSPSIFICLETRQVAADLLGSIYPHLDNGTRTTIEQQILAMPSGADQEGKRESLQRAADTILGCIPLELIATAEARERRRELDASGGAPPKLPKFEMGKSRHISDDEFLRHQGVENDEPQNARFRQVQTRVKEFCNRSDEQITIAEIREFLPVLADFETVSENAERDGVHRRLWEFAYGYIYSCCEKMSRCNAVTSDTEEYGILRHKLLKGARHPEPHYRAEEDESWDDRGGTWGTLPRISAAEATMRLAGLAATADAEILDAIQALAKDPVPAVRHMIASDLLQLWNVDRNLFWELAEHFSKAEPRVAVLRLFVQAVLLNLPRGESSRVDRLSRRIYSRFIRNPKGGPVREACAMHFLRRALWVREPKAGRWLRRAVKAADKYHVELMTMVGACRKLLSHDDPENSEEENKRVRGWAFEFLGAVFQSANPACAGYFKVSQATLSEDEIKRAEGLFHLLEHVVHQIYFACEVFEEARNESGALIDIDAKRRFAVEGSELLDILCQCPVSRIAYDVLKILELLRDADPRKMFLRAETVVTTAVQDGLQFESMAADLVVRIVEEYLAEYRGLFRQDQEMLKALMDLLDQFVAAGWPRAVSLTYRLDEVFRG